ncbi:MAG TPA: nuclear transport factor 2 family protein [Solirubrobacterales bacterium]|nr:nuclear transport factor 2 family protein [Solirubrobacterales bacterium]
MIERLFIAVIRGEPEAVVELVHPQVEWSPTVWSGQEVYRGHEGVRRWLAQFGEGLEHLDVRVEKVRQEGERGAVLGTVFDSRDEGMFAVRIAWSFELEDGLLRRGRAHQTWEEAVREAGVS